MSREQLLLNRIRKLNRIGIMLSRERHLDQLLSNIVAESRDFFDCEGGSLFIKEGKELIFRIAQNDVLKTELDLAGKQIAISETSLAGYVAKTGEVLTFDDVYEIPEDSPYHFDKSYDAANHYRTRSMLIVPLKTYNGEVIGVLQLINPRQNGEVITFGDFDGEEDLIYSLASQATIAITNARLIDQMRDAHVDTIFRLSVAAEYKDEDTASHLERMCRYSALIADKLGFDSDFVDMVKLSSPMHDVGKIGIPDAVLMKPGRLTEHEFTIMKKHPEIGAHILGGSDSPLLKMAETIALCHHEKYDGSGYPRGVAGEDIPMEGRIVALADVFDALTSKRCYKPAWPIEKAIDLIKETRGVHFDPAVVDVFLAELSTVLEIKRRFADDLHTPTEDEESSIRG